MVRVRHGPFCSLSSPFPLLFPFPSFNNYSSFSFSFPFSFFLCFFFPFSFSFPIPVLFLFLSFRFPFPFSFLSLSFPFLSLSFSSPFPIFSLSSLMWILWSRCEASAWNTDKREKNDHVWKKTTWKGLFFFTRPHMFIWVCLNGYPKFWWLVLMFPIKKQINTYQNLIHHPMP